MNAELILDAKSKLGEGSIWDPALQVLWWIDIEGRTLFRYDPGSSENRAYEMPSRIGTVVPRRENGLVVALENGFSHFDPESGNLEFITDPEAHLPDNRFNDGKCDPTGRFWAGTMAMRGDRTGKGSLYCLFPDGTCEKKIEGVSVSNGLCWSLDATTFYYIDTPTKRIDAYTYDNDTGVISEPRVAVRIPEDTGMPDGMTMDDQGNLWVAQWGGYRVACYDPNTGKQIDQIDLPTGSITSCAFGGPDRGTLYITCASAGFDEERWKKEPHGGGLFQARPGVRGLPACTFAG